jgi:hypothetical protein
MRYEVHQRITVLTVKATILNLTAINAFYA